MEPSGVPLIGSPKGNIGMFLYYQGKCSGRCQSSSGAIGHPRPPSRSRWNIGMFLYGRIPNVGQTFLSASFVRAHMSNGEHWHVPLRGNGPRRADIPVCLIRPCTPVQRGTLACSSTGESPMWGRHSCLPFRLSVAPNSAFNAPSLT